jgi:hypothetical protein
MLIISPGLIARRCLIEFALEYCHAGSIEPTQREGWAVQRTPIANATRWSGYGCKPAARLMRSESL